MLNLNVEDRHVKTRNAVDDHQLLSTKKLLKKINKLVINDRRLSVDFIAESVGISIGNAHFDFEREFDDDESLHDGCRACYQTFRRQIALKHPQVFSVCLMKIQSTLFLDL